MGSGSEPPAGGGGGGVVDGSNGRLAADRAPPLRRPRRRRRGRGGGGRVGVLGVGCIRVSSADGLGENGRSVFGGSRRQLLQTPILYRHRATGRPPSNNEILRTTSVLKFCNAASDCGEYSINSRWRSRYCILWCSRNCSSIFNGFNEIFKLPLLVVFHSVMNPATSRLVGWSSFTGLTRCDGTLERTHFSKGLQNLMNCVFNPRSPAKNQM
jgi:hypothetical protein